MPLMLTAAVLLVQCAMPPQQAWRYIQTNGLFPYLSATASPPFRTGGSYSQRYATSQTYPRRTTSASSWSNWNSRTPNRGYYGTSGYASNSYFSAPSSGAPRYVPRVRSSPSASPRRPSVKLSVEEPAPAPQITHNAPPVSPAPKNNGSGTTPVTGSESMPYGTAVPGRMNMVNSPFAGKTQLVDVSGMSAGQTVKCPYTGKLFKVPPTQQAANHAEPRHESKVETPKMSDEAKGGEKKP